MPRFQRYLDICVVILSLGLCIALYTYDNPTTPDTYLRTTTDLGDSTQNTVVGFHNIETNDTGLRFRWGRQYVRIPIAVSSYKSNAAIVSFTGTTYTTQPIQISVNDHPVPPIVVQGQGFRHYAVLVRNFSIHQHQANIVINTTSAQVVNDQVLGIAMSAVSYTPLAVAFLEPISQTYTRISANLNPLLLTMCAFLLIAHMFMTPSLFRTCTYMVGIIVLITSMYITPIAPLAILLSSLTWLGAYIIDPQHFYVTWLSTAFHDRFSRAEAYMQRAFPHVHQFLWPRVDTTLNDAINRFVLVSTAIVALVTMCVTTQRTTLKEGWDRLILLGAGSTAIVVCGMFIAYTRWQFLRRARLSAFVDSHVVNWFLFSITVIFAAMTFQAEARNLDFNGFPYYVLIAGILITPFINGIITGTMHQSTRLILRLYALFLGIGGAYSVFQINDSASVIHNMFVINEVFVPNTSLIAFQTYIPQYSTLNSLLVYGLRDFGYLQFPTLSFNIAVWMLQGLCVVVLALAVRITYKNMAVPQWSTAVLFAIPPFMFATYPWWELFSRQTVGYYSMHMFSFSLIAVRELVVFSLGFVGIATIARLQHWAPLWRQLLAVYALSLLATLGLYHNSDFGASATLAVGGALCCYPFITVRTRFVLTSVYLLAVIVNYIALITLLSCLGLTVNVDYLFWFQRQFASGLGAAPILFPGNGVLLITLAVVVTTTAVWLSTALQNHISPRASDTKFAYVYTSVVYFGITTTLSLSYYVNRSYMSFQGSSIYITLCMALFALYNLTVQLQSAPQQRQPLHFSNYTLRFLVTLPLCIALTHPYIPFKFTNQPPSRTMLSQFDTEYAQLTDIYHKLGDAGIPAAYAGNYANVVNTLFAIPAVNVFNSLADANISNVTQRVYCDNLATADFAVILVSRHPREELFPCDQFDIIPFKNVSFDIVIKHSLREQFPDKVNTIAQMINFYGLNTSTAYIRLFTDAK